MVNTVLSMQMSLQRPCRLHRTYIQRRNKMGTQRTFLQRRHSIGTTELDVFTVMS